MAGGVCVSDACCVLGIFGIVYLAPVVDEPRPRSLLVAREFDEVMVEFVVIVVVEVVILDGVVEDVVGVVDDDDAVAGFVFVTVNFRPPRLPCLIAN